MPKLNRRLEEKLNTAVSCKPSENEEELSVLSKAGLYTFRGSISNCAMAEVLNTKTSVKKDITFFIQPKYWLLAEFKTKTREFYIMVLVSIDIKKHRIFLPCASSYNPKSSFLFIL